MNSLSAFTSAFGMRRLFSWVLPGALALPLLTGGAADAASFRVLLESDPDGGNSDVFLTSFDTFDDLVNSPPGGGPGGFSGLKIAPGFSIGGLFYDGKYRVLLESDPDGGNADVFITSFDTFDDLINSPPGGGPGGFSGLKIAPGFSIGGVAYDGKYRVLLESDPDGGNADIFLTSFDTFDDLINSPPGGGPGGFSGLKIASGFSVGGFAYDGKYRVLLESDPDGGNADIFLTSFDTFDDLINSPPGGGPGGFSGLKIASGFSVGGLAYEFDPDTDPDGPAPVPLPASMPLMAVLTGLLAVLSRRKRS